MPVDVHILENHAWKYYFPNLLQAPPSTQGLNSRFSCPSPTTTFNPRPAFPAKAPRAPPPFHPFCFQAPGARSTPEFNAQPQRPGPNVRSPTTDAPLPHTVPFAVHPIPHAPGNPDLVRGERASDPDLSLKAGRGGVCLCLAASPPRCAP